MTTPASQPRSEASELLSEEEARLRTDLYLKQRIQYQEAYYQSRIDEFTFNSEVMLWVSAGLMGISTVIASYSVLAENVWYSFITALLPAFAALVSAFRALYQWERQATLYRSTWLALQQAKLALPDPDFPQPGDFATHFPELVRQTEEVLRNETAQWGQIENVGPQEE
jgi:hypothetical protein